MGSKGKLAVKFRERTALGTFCSALSEGEIPFTLGGFQTVVIAEKDFQSLAERVRQLVTDFGSVTAVRRGEKRPPLPTPKETQDLLRKFAAKPS